MCTLTINFEGRRARTVFSRDEKRDREPASAPAWRMYRGVRAAAPTDGRAGGTWIAANEHGLVLCLLNANPHGAVTPPEPAWAVSRGVIAPSLIHHREAESAVEELLGRDLSCFAPFRLVALGAGEGGALLEVSWDRRVVAHRVLERRPACVVSSGLGDSVVRPRLELFEEFCRWGFDAGAQDRFHRHRWPEQPEISVMMARQDARTVSITTVTVEVAGAAPLVRMSYEPVGEAGAPLGAVVSAQTRD